MSFEVIDENGYYEWIKTSLKDGLRDMTGDGMATDPHHLLGSMWESGKSLKTLDWFVIPLSKRRHLEFHRGQRSFEKKYGTQRDLLLKFWGEIGFEPGEFMFTGLSPKESQRLKRILDRL